MASGPDLKLHHVGYAVNAIAPIAATYVDRLGYHIVTPVIHDPRQTAFVQFLKLPNDQVYLEFVAPDSPESKLANAISKGARLNHLCYSTSNLDATLAELDARGMRLISRPQPAVAFASRRICWFIGHDHLPLELVERRDPTDPCFPGLAEPALDPQEGR